MDKKTVRAWCFYDFGNSAFAVVFTSIFSAYYASTVVTDGSGEKWWGYTVSLSMLVVALSSPLLGGIADHAGVRKRMLAIYTAIAIAATLCFSFVSEGAVVLGFLLAVVANAAFEGGIVFYNAYLPVIAPASRQGRVSAHGFAVGYVGSLLALGIAALLVNHGWLTAVWVAVAVQWAIASLPAFRHLPADKPTGMSVQAAALAGLRQTTRTWKRVMGMRNLRRFLFGYFLYMDGVNTVITFAAVYAKKELNFETTELIAMIGMVQVTALVGSLAMAGPSDRRGPRWAVLQTLIWWMFVVILAITTGVEGFAHRKSAFWIVAGLSGLGLGSIQAASRALMSHLIPDGHEAEFFGFYALCGKTGAILGPMILIGLGALLGSLRLGLISVAVLYALGYWLVRGVKDPSEQKQPRAEDAERAEER